MPDGYIRASYLASQLKMPIPALLILCDKTIEAEYRKGGLEAIRGFSIGTSNVGNHSIPTVSPALADFLRNGSEIAPG